MTEHGLSASMGNVMALLRQGDPMAATALIQQRLGAGPLAAAAPARSEGPAQSRKKPAQAKPARDPRKPRIRPLRSKAGAGGDGGMQRLNYQGPAGGRDYLLFAPETPAKRPGLVVMLHGCTQSAADFARGTGMNAAAGARGFHVIYPEQASDANPMRCWNWFEPGHQSAGGGEPVILAGLIEDAKRQAGLAEADVFVAGLSAGGAMAAILAQAFPGQILAAGVHSGLPVGAASSMPGAFQAMKSGAPAGRDSGVPLIVFHGDADQTVVPANGAAVAAHVGRGAHYRGHAAGGLAWQADKGPGGEYWRVEGMGHAWSGGDAGGSYTDPRGPDASAEMMRFFAERRGQ